LTDFYQNLKTMLKTWFLDYSWWLNEVLVSSDDILWIAKKYLIDDIKINKNEFKVNISVEEILDRNKILKNEFLNLSSWIDNEKVIK